MPLTGNPDAFYLSDVEFWDRFGFERPRPRRPSEDSRGGGAGASGARSNSPDSTEMMNWEVNAGRNPSGDGATENEVVNCDHECDGSCDTQKGVEEVVFYCKAGVRSRAAARMAREWDGVRVGDMKGGWLEWAEKGGKVEKGIAQPRMT